MRLRGCPVYPIGRDKLVLLLYDNVPGGAGRVQALADRAGELIAAAVERVSGSCGCGKETSCYGCLRAYANQFKHDRLTRTGALAVFGLLTELE